MRKFVALAVMATGISGFASEAVWNQNDTATRYWGTTAHWLVDGAVPSEPPTNNVNVTFPHLNGWQQPIVAGLDTSIQNAYSLNLGKLTGDTTHYLCLGHSWTSGHYNPRKPITVQDPNDFTGFWDVRAAQQCLFFPATDSFTPIVHNLNLEGRPHLHFHGAGQAIVEAAYNDGAFVKTGEVEMVLKSSMGATALAYVTGGGLTLEGHAADDTLDELLANAYMHLDATSDSYFDFCEGSETSVTNWYDVRGRGYPYAHVPTPNEIGTGGSRCAYWAPPFVGSETSSTGLRLLDFGSSCTGDGDTTYGPTNCMLHFARILNGSDIFVVGRYHEGSAFARGTAFLGDISQAPLQPWGGAIFGGSANRLLREGYMTLNGKTVKTDYGPADKLTSLSVLSFGGSTNVELSVIGSDQLYANRTGGMLIGEILVYTNGLTQAERLRIIDYLNRRWRTGGTADQSADAGAVLLYAKDTSVGVPAGKSAKVVDLVARDGKVIKTGAGTLYADSVFPSNAELDIRGGKVVVKPFVGTTVNTGVAANPLVRLDASAAGTVTTEYNETYDKNYVTSWADCRSDVETVAVPFSKLSAPRHPTVATAASPTGLDVVDFGKKGTGASGDQSAMTLPWYGTKTSNVYAGFIVMRQLVSDYSFVPFFGCEDFTFERERSGGHKAILNHSYAYPGTYSALWTINGTPLDPVEQRDEYFGPSAPFIVVSFSSRTPLNCSAIAMGRGEPGRTGAIQVGEFILYDRPLSHKEQRDTEAYLMNKWLGMAHPTATLPAPSYKFAADVDAVLETDADLPLPAITGGTGRFIKGGSGTVTGTANRLVDAGMTRIAVEDGTLNLSAAKTEDGAYYHFDASDVDSMTYTVDADTTNLTAWADTDGRDMCATNVTMQYANGTPYIDTRVFPDGKTRCGVNFGNAYVSSSARAMWMDHTYVKAFREGITVFATTGSDYRQAMFCTNGKNSDPYSGTVYQRGNDASLTTSDHVETYTDWFVYEYDNNQVVSTDGSYTLPDKNPHLVGSRPAKAVTVNALCFQQVFGGGQMLFEQVGFTNQLSAARRDWWYKHLAYKWFGQGADPVWVDVAFDELSVKSGASIELSGVGNVSSRKLAGAGSISTTASVSGVEEFAIGIDELLSGEALALDGAFAFAANTEVTLDDSESGAKLRPGVGYTLIEGECVADIDISGWTVNAPASHELKQFSVTKVGNSIVLMVKGPGMMIIIK